MKDKFLGALELDKKGDWEGAHNLIKDMSNKVAYWIHGYLHRKESDLNKATYWYYMAKRSMPAISFEQEWDEIRKFVNEHYIS